MAVVHDTSSCHDDNLCQIIFKSHNAQSLSVTVTLTFDLAIQFLLATYHRVIMIIFTKLFSNPTMHNKVMGLTRPGFTEVYAQSLSANCDLDL